MRLIWCMFWDCPGLLDIVTNSFSPILDSEPLTLGPGSSLFISVTLQRVWWLVRKSSQEVLLILLEQDLIFQHDIENKVCPILLALSAPDGEAEYKAEAVSVICKLASVLSKSTVERRLLPRFCELCGDGKSFKFGRVRVNLAVEPVAIWRLTRGMAAAHLKRINLNRRKKSFPGGILMDDATLRCHDVVPGGIISLRIWHYDGWTELVLAAVEGDSSKLLRSLIPSPARVWHPSKLLLQCPITHQPGVSALLNSPRRTCVTLFTSPGCLASVLPKMLSTEQQIRSILMTSSGRSGFLRERSWRCMLPHTGVARRLFSTF
ncbi:ankyrin repeat domain-containing protein 60 isoform X2 [Tursiops truncatus]|uniref:ankyrin repeat domain-containing protein 60 isoform X2 n=1 Tax=Tursiops truncatus TaxID=9739 RepID=UPI003CCFC1A8